jgi:hypothetical protein
MFAIFAEKLLFNTKLPLTPMVKQAYESYFGCKVGDQDKQFAPRVCCITCTTILREWPNNKGRSMPFALQMFWREQTDHLTDCNFCIIPPLRHGIKKKNCQIS